MSSSNIPEVSVDALAAPMSPSTDKVDFVVVAPGEDIDEGESIESSNAPPLVQPAASRLISCLRAPCLKRVTSVTPALSPTSASESSVSPDGGSSAASSGDEAVVSGSSFRAIKRVVGTKACARQVHFDIAPPQAGITHSGDLYDRRPIECTRRGEENDLSLPPRGTCQLYSGDADDESGANDDDDEDETSSAERLRGFARWSRLKKTHGAMKAASVLSPSFVPSAKASSSSSRTHGLLSESDDASDRSKLADDGDNGSQVDSESVTSMIELASDDEDDRNTCSQPFHGVRSFGRIADRPDEPHIHASKGYDERALAASRDDIVDKLNSVEEDEDPEHEAFKQAVYAALALSPNATPMPSPSVRSRWESVTSYFDSEGAAAELGSGKSSGSTTPGPGIVVVDESGHADVVKAQGSELLMSPPPEKRVQREDYGQDVAAEASRDGTSSPLESSAVASTSPMSSRSSSADAMGSPGERVGRQTSSVNAFDSAFAMHGLSSFSVADTASHASVASGSKDVLTQRSMPYRAASEESEPYSCASSSTSGGTFAASKSGSCSTSPDLGCNEPDFANDVETKSTPTRTPTLLDARLAQELIDEPSASPGEKDAIRDSPTQITRVAHRALSLGVPSALIKFYTTAPNGELSPCVQSADERDHMSNDAALADARSNGKAVGFSLMPDPSMASTMLRRSNSSSGTSRKVKRNPRRVASTGCEGEQAKERSGSTTPEEGVLLEKAPRSSRSSGRDRTNMGPRSKSMSAAQTGAIKRSSFASATFRSEIDDDGALGGF